MKKAKLILAVAVLISLGNVGCQKLIYPTPEIINTKVAPPIWIFYPDMFLTIRNTGASGKILITVTQGNNSCKRIVYFDRDEQREIKLSCPELNDKSEDKYKLKFYLPKPVDLASPEELKNARIGSD